MSEPSSFNAFADALAQFDRLADLMGLDTPTRELLRNPAHEHRLTLPVRLDDGKVEIFHGFRVQHNDARGPSWGGVRFHQSAASRMAKGSGIMRTYLPRRWNIPRSA